MAQDKVMVFIDGENLVMRYQDMVKDGKRPLPSIEYERDTYVWSPQIVKLWDKKIIRFTYYTYAVGDDQRIRTITEKIKNITFDTGDQSYCNPRKGYLYPKVFKKENQDAKRKGVDIQITVDILTHVYQNNIDAFLLLSGDGDYHPVIEEGIRQGKQVYLGAFSKGLKHKMKSIVDDFINLDSLYFMT